MWESRGRNEESDGGEVNLEEIQDTFGEGDELKELLAVRAPERSDSKECEHGGLSH
jgi:hypothetical protein